MDTDNTKSTYPEKELTEKIIGCSFRVFNDLGYGLVERIYQTAMAVELSRTKLKFEKELFGKVIFRDVVVGGYFLDFLVEKKVALDWKDRLQIRSLLLTLLL